MSDFFKLLANIDKTNYNDLSDEDKKAFNFFLANRALSCSSEELQVISVNEFVNPYIMPLGNHPELLYRLLKIAKFGKSLGSWIPMKSAKKTLAQKVLMDYYKISSLEYSKMEFFEEKDDIIKMAESLGYDDKEIKALKKELK